MRQLLGALAAFVVGPASAQFGLPDLGIDLPGLDDLFKKEPPLTTTLDDCWIGVPQFDSFEPECEPTELTAADLSPGEVWQLEPGYYTFTLASFCLKSASYGPSRGMGYVPGVFLGPQADVFQNIIERWTEREDIPQERAQTLIWALLARTKPSELGSDLRAVAEELLTPEELAALEGNGLDAIQEDLLRRALGEVDEVLRPIYEAENQVRSLVPQANAPFDELERLMVTVAPEDLPSEFPETRWHVEPNGRYLVRFEPIAYYETKWFVYVPEPVVVERDEMGRVSAVIHGDFRSEPIYDETAEPFPFEDDPSLTVWQFEAVRFVGPDRSGAEVDEVVPMSGWMFASSNPLASLRASTGLSSLLRRDRPSLTDMRERYERFQDLRDQYDNLNQELDRARRLNDNGPSPGEVLDLNHYRDGLEQAANPDLMSRFDWIRRHTNAVSDAWNWASNALSDGTTEVSPTRRIAMPGNPGSQRLGQSGRTR